MNEASVSLKEEIKKLLSDKSFKKIFILSGRNSFTKSNADKFFKNNLNNKKIFVYLKKSYYVEFNELKEIINNLNQFKPDLIIAVGGGSVIDYAKSANVLQISENLKKKIQTSTYKPKKKISKLLAIPTTAGSGAEVTSAAVIYIDKKKYSVEGNLFKPDYFLLIPEFVINGSNEIKSSSGFDAISQSLESIISLKSNKQSLNFAKKSLFYSLKYFIPSLVNPNSENVSKMCIAANLSGKAISISKTTAPHAVSYPFTALYKIPHGHAVSLTLEKFLKFNFEHINLSEKSINLKKRLEIILDLTKTRNILELQAFIKHLKKKANLNDNLNELGINIQKDYSKIIFGVSLQRLNNNPIKIEKKDLKKILLSL